jgi:hypothetical protein
MSDIFERTTCLPTACSIDDTYRESADSALAPLIQEIRLRYWTWACAINTNSFEAADVHQYVKSQRVTGKISEN